MTASTTLLWSALALAFPGPLAETELSAGVSTLAYQSVFSFSSGAALEAAVHGALPKSSRWTVGTRLGLGPVLPEVFARFSLAPALGRWLPTLGLELGATARSRFDHGSGLLAEMRAASASDISPFFVALHAAAARFRLWERWRLSALELQVGTHLDRPGRTLRIQLGLLTAGVML